MQHIINLPVIKLCNVYKRLLGWSMFNSIIVSQFGRWNIYHWLKQFFLGSFRDSRSNVFENLSFFNKNILNSKHTMCFFKYMYILSRAHRIKNKFKIRGIKKEKWCYCHHWMGQGIITSCRLNLFLFQKIEKKD